MLGTLFRSPFFVGFLVLSLAAVRAPGSVLPQKSDGQQEYDKNMCEHSCVRVMNDVCISEWGELLTARQVERLRDTNAHPGFEDKYVPFVTAYDVWFFGNPQHQVHELWYPILFYAENCGRQNPNAMLALPSVCSSYSLLFNPLIRSMFPPERIIGGRCKTDDMAQAPELFSDNQHNEVQARRTPRTARCFKTAHVLLNMFRGWAERTCMFDSSYRHRDVALWKDIKFNYKHAGQLGVMAVRDDETLEPVPNGARQQALLRVRGFLSDRMKWRYPSSPIKLADLGKKGGDPLRVYIAARKNVGKRQENEGSLVAGLQRAFERWNLPNARVTVGLFGGGTEKLNVIAQMKEFYNSDVVIAVHGAQLANSIAMRAGSLIISQCTSEVTCKRWEHASAPLLGQHTVAIQSDHWNSTGVTDFMVAKITSTLGEALGVSTDLSVTKG